jgi:Phage Tail Collar Domain
LKGAVIGFVCAVLGGATVALAGSGIGGVFNLGVTNSVNAQTSLSGSTTTPQLRVTNTNTGSGAAGLQVNSAANTPTFTASNSAGGVSVLALGTAGVAVFGKTASPSQPALSGNNTGGGPAGSFSVNSAVPPFTVNSQTKVANLNADRLDGLDSSALQKRVSGTCAAGTAVRVVNSDGSVACQAVGAGGVFVGHFGTNTGNAGLANGTTCTLGEIRLTASPVLTAGGAPAAGQLLAINQNQALFSLLGTTYGGNGQTTFQLPDLRPITPNNMTYSICVAGVYPGPA